MASAGGDSTAAVVTREEADSLVTDNERSRTVLTTTKRPLAIDSDPEFFHGLTMWSEDRPDGFPAFAAQVRESGVDLVFNERRDDGHVGSRFEQEIPLADARRLRDLLNVATARGYL